MTTRYPSRIVCLTEETTETLYVLGAGDRVVGVQPGPVALTEGVRQIHARLAAVVADTAGPARVAAGSG